MKNFSRGELEASRPSIDALVGINFCLSALYADRQRAISDSVVESMTFEELLGVFLLACDEINENRANQEDD